ncbi:MAG: DNA repair protein RadC [Bacteroidales bacterium]|nr:DNA repair protein RadC [Bacteroidales bacterium]MCB8999930.1 DNA repair protein RadC [Bacteroidales bacterium]MCB9012619.1 DNA repair protein RadC [Bacteroidales bacterium]
MEYKKLIIRNWSLEDRPREKLLNHGVNSLSDAELLAILLGSGTRNTSAVDLARQILEIAGNNLHQLGKLSFSDLSHIRGIGKAKALMILSAFELGRRRTQTDTLTKLKISSSKDVFKLFQPLLGDIPHEEFWILILNRSNQVIDKVRISQGGISGTVIDSRLILKNAIDRLASGLILCHNHPSGNTQPSDADKKITEKIQKAAAFMEINLLDHIIIADKNFFSFADEGLL